MILTISEFFRKDLVCIWFAYSEYDSGLHFYCRCTIFDGRYGVFFYGLGSYLVESFGNKKWCIE